MSALSMQETLMKHLVGCLSDPLFTDIICEFYALQGRIIVSDGGRGEIVKTTETLLDSIVGIMRDECELDRLDHLLDTHYNMSSATTQLDEIVEHVESTKHIIRDDSFFDYIVTILWLFHTKIVADDNNSERRLHDCPSILTKLDTYLALLGLTRVSTLTLWTKAAHLGTRRDDLWNAVKALLVAVDVHCHVDDVV
jgi:hypothetical protein